jgi:hypothetical protein
MFVDYVDKLQLTKDYAEKHGNELKSLRYLARGLWFLHEQISQIETQIAAKIPKGKHVFHFGNSPDLEGIPQDLVACTFHWYAVTACNYVKMVGWLANNGDSTKAREYMAKVLPAVHLWRHKVAAHFAIIDPRTGDNAADLAMSVIFPVSYDNNAFYTGSLTLTMSTGGKQSTNRQDMRWSLTQTHKELIPRYWPPSS